jgi:hypothetical protein
VPCSVFKLRLRRWRLLSEFGTANDWFYCLEMRGGELI